MSPIYILKLYNNIDIFIDLIIKDIQYHYILGFIINKSSLTNTNNLKGDPHCYYTYLNFIKNNPEWKETILNFNALNDTINNNYIWNNNIEENSFTMLYSYN